MKTASVRGRGHCAVCAVGLTLNRSGGIRAHHTRRVDSQGVSYIAAAECLGSGQPPEPWDESEEL